MTAPALELRRIDAARNMRRFYRLDMQPDLFGAEGPSVRERTLRKVSDRCFGCRDA
jgi:predicted DNA-binding WGR domain protein